METKTLDTVDCAYFPDLDSSCTPYTIDPLWSDSWSEADEILNDQLTRMTDTDWKHLEEYDSQCYHSVINELLEPLLQRKSKIKSKDITYLGF